MGKENSSKIKINQEQNMDYLKPRSYTFDTKKYQIKINRGKINFFGNNTIQRYIEGNESRNEDRKNIFLNTNKLPKIVTRISLSNFHKKNNNNLEGEMNNNNLCSTANKFSLFHKTLGNFGFKGITFNSGLSGLRSTNYKFNVNNNNIMNLNNINNNCKLLNSHKEIYNHKSQKEQLLTPNNVKINNINIINDNLNKFHFNDTKEKKKLYSNKNSFNTKTVINNNNKYYNNINNNNNVLLFKKNEFIKEKLIVKSKENEEKNNLCEENNDSFINELNDLFSNVKANNDSIPYFQENINDNKNIESDEDDKEPDPRINFEQISRVNQSRPQTSYGGLNARRKNLQSAMANIKNKVSRPTTSNIPEFNN